MPNWCDTTVAFYSDDITKIETAHHIIKKSYDLRDSNRWVGYLIEKFITNPDKSKIGRSFVSYISDEIERAYCDGWNYNIWYFRMDLDDAWGPYPEELEMIADRFDLKYCYVAEEPGCEVYINTDSTGMIFTDNYVLDCEFDHTYFMTEEDLVEAFNDYFKSDCKTYEDCRSYDVSDLTDEFCVVARFEPG